MRYRLLQSLEDEKMCLDQDLDTNQFLLSIPIFDGNRQYLESYKLTPEEYWLASQDAAARQALTAKCRARENDDRMSQPLPPVRGEPCPPGKWRGSSLIQMSLDNGREFRVYEVFQKEQFAFGYDQKSQKYILQIRVDLPTVMSDVTSDESYEVTEEEVGQVLDDPEALIYLAAKCQTHNNDANLLGDMRVPRGSPCHVGKWP
ncbi:hypothetical protein [Prosthecobacter dejongeii]|uniref:Uncharacterized protein n=1 Tax=Prosthecobacter dejongeii TaxID=48465 RepID=A0A7W8DR88_9BACT|nr:hypothetical protein [Prosthecobacter dejongeii]MBB5039005.1 hypothetical protein [Prosthecobacter dejongeii]